MNLLDLYQKNVLIFEKYYMWFIILFLCLIVGIISTDLKKEMGIIPWSQWIIVGGLVLYMVIVWIF